MSEKYTISVRELAVYLGVSNSVAYRLVHREDFPVLRLGKRILIPVAGLTEWIANQSKASKKE